MVTISRITKKKANKLIEFSFLGDTDLVEQYHAVNDNMQDSILHTIERIDICSMAYELKFYKVEVDNESAGFFVIGDNFLYSFGLNIRFRKKDILLQWWAMVCAELKPNFICMMNKKNTRGINFLKKQGMIVISNGNEILTLKY